MTDLIVFKLGRTPADPAAWGAFADGAIVEAGRVANVEALNVIAGRLPEGVRVVAVLQGEQVAMREIPAPPKQTSKLLAAATYILEDELAEPVEDLHVVVSSTSPRVAYAISRKLIGGWLAAFDAIGLAVTEMAPDYACIGGSPTACVIAADRDRMIASRGAAGFAAEIGLAERIAPKFIEEARDAVIIAYGGHDAIGGWSARPIERRPLAHEADLVALFGSAFSSKTPPTSLLAGEFRRRAASSFNFAPYRRVAALAAGLAVALIFSGIAAGVRDMRVAGAYETSASAMHKAAFPTFSGSDIRSHARQILADGGAAASFIDMSSRLTASLEGHDGVAIDRIRYDGARGQFVFSIRSDTDAGIEAFRMALDANGIVASDSGGYRRSGEAWIGEMSARAK
ncbi:MAG: hypothetical protein KDE05_13555 [Parvularculaceae bacterium]|nr:hypothetical protein [Parvularculaceae bacterium]